MSSEILKDETKIAVIGVNVVNIQKDIAEIKDSIKNLPGTYLTQKEHVEFVTAVEKRFTALETRRQMWNILNPIIASGFTAVFVFLLIAYLQGVK